jgi:hypothetical protein
MVELVSKLPWDEVAEEGADDTPVPERAVALCDGALARRWRCFGLCGGEDVDAADNLLLAERPAMEERWGSPAALTEERLAAARLWPNVFELPLAEGGAYAPVAVKVVAGNPCAG